MPTRSGLLSTTVAIALVVVAGCARQIGAGSSGGREPSATIGYCGMDPEPVPCVDRVGDGEAPPTPVGPPHVLGGTCGSQFDADRCQALAFGAAEQLGVRFEQVIAVDVVPNPSPGPGPDFAHRTFLEVTLADGSRRDVTISCPGIAACCLPPCMAEPAVPVGSPWQAGYHDRPGDATPLPSLEPDAVRDARPLSIPRLTIPVDSLGRHEIGLGQATLPNGYLSFSNLQLADPWPSNVLFKVGVGLEVTPASGGPPLENVYETGWQHGTVAVDVTLTFDVVWFEPGASFEIVDVVVR